MTTIHTHRPLDWHCFAAYGLRCLRAPNRYRKMLMELDIPENLEKGVSYSDIRDAVIARQAREFDYPDPLGLDIHPGDFDVILIWKL